jgi:hypothetical protein
MKLILNKKPLMFKSRVFCVFLLFSFTGYGQTGIRIWGDTTHQLINHRVVDMLEADNIIFMMSKSMDENYEYPHISLSASDLQGNIQYNHTLFEQTAIYELGSVLQCPDGDIMLFGTGIIDEKLIPYSNIVNIQGETKFNTACLTFTSHYLGKIIPYDTSYYIYSYAVQSTASGIYNIRAEKIAYQGNHTGWKVSIDSEKNDECNGACMSRKGAVLLLAKRYTDNSFREYYPVLFYIDSLGALLWEKEFNDHPNCKSQAVCFTEENDILLSVSYANKYSASCSSEVFKINEKGDILHTITISEMLINGIISQNKESILFFGSNYILSMNTVVAKAKAMSINGELNSKYMYQMSLVDEPDCSLPGLGISVFASSSEYLCAITLNDGRVALAGRVYMPLITSSPEIIVSKRVNKNLLVILNEDLSY